MKKGLILVMALVLVFGATGCIKIKKKGTATVNALGGVYMTADRMETWKQRSQLMTPGETPGSISDVDVLFIVTDPSDEKAMYLGTRANGLYYTYNSGAGWMNAGTLPAGIVRDVAVDAKDKCNIYVAVSGRIFKSEDCNRTWKSVWFADNAEQYVSALAVDWYEPKIVYAGLSNGRLLKSEDFGLSWKAIKTFNNRVRKIIVDPNDSRTAYFGISNGGLQKTTDKGTTWVELNKGMKDFEGYSTYYDFEVAKRPANEIVYANKHGILKSLDAGTTWSKLTLMTKPEEEVIYALGIDPSDPNFIYYATNSKLYKSIDGGKNWSVKQMPTTRVASDLVIDLKEKSTIYMSAKELVE